MRSIQEETALYHAAAKGYTPTMQLLLANGADVHAQCGVYVSGACTCTRCEPSLQTHQKYSAITLTQNELCLSTSVCQFFLGDDIPIFCGVATTRHWLPCCKCWRSLLLTAYTTFCVPNTGSIVPSHMLLFDCRFMQC